MDRLRSCVCNRPLHTYTLVPAERGRQGGLLQVDKTCCRCPKDCLCHSQAAIEIWGVGNWGAVVPIGGR